ncbi:MAG: HIT family protein [Bacteroidia bacterium]
MESIFSKIVKGEIPCYKIAETENCLAFLDVNPLVEGHVLVIPKKEIDYIFDLDEAVFCELHLLSKQVAKAIQKIIHCKRIGIAVIGLEVPHAHIHLVPLNTIGDINFSREKMKISDAELEEVGARIAEAFDSL